MEKIRFPAKVLVPVFADDEEGEIRKANSREACRINQTVKNLMLTKKRSWVLSRQ